MGNACTNGTLDEHFPDHMTTSTFEAYIEEQNKHIPQTGKIRMLTYNIFIRPPGISNNGDDFKDERLTEFLKHAHSYDIICLQEMFASYSSRKKDFIDKAKETGFLYSASSPKHTTLSTHFSDAGLLILSRYPIVASEFMAYTSGVGADLYANKGVLYAMIKIGRSRLHLYNTHAQATYDDSLKWFMKRTEQFHAFQQYIKKTLVKHRYREDDLVLLAGDFNVNCRDTRKFNFKKRGHNSHLDCIESLMKADSFTEYDALKCCLNDNGNDFVEDLGRKKFPEGPITYGDYTTNHNNERIPVESILTHKLSLCSSESLDYIFRYVPKSVIPEWSGRDGLAQRIMQQKELERVRNQHAPTDSKPSAKPMLSIIEDSVAIDKFQVKGHAFDYLSDHYGVSVTLDYFKRPTLEKMSTRSESLDATDLPAFTPNMSVAHQDTPVPVVNI